MGDLANDVKVKESGGYKDKMWVPRMWNGMRWWHFVKLLARNGFLVDPYRWPMALINLFAGHVTDGFRLYQYLTIESKVRRTEIVHDPVFIIGHWRSGTTMLHEILIKDPQFGYPDTFSCFAAQHFLVSRPMLTSLLRLPETRPMDNVAFGWTAPQEDEFALCALGIPSPYLQLAFPRNNRWKGRYEQLQKYLDLSGLTDEEMARWQNGLRWFMRELTYRDDRRLVLKSPTHTARVGVLKQMFPNAKFIHICRNPNTLYASTINLWKRFLQSEAFQRTDGAYLEELVFESLERMYRAYFRDTAQMSPSDLIEIRYEDLCADKIGTMRTVYEQLGLGDFEKFRPSLEIYCEEKKGYKKNKFEISPELEAKIAERWGLYFDRFGY